jgi:hypothetical protein
LAFFYRAIENNKEKEIKILELCSFLSEVADEYGLAVVLVNHVTTRGESDMIPALGEAFTFATANSIMLDRVQGDDEKREFRILKSLGTKVGRGQFVVKDEGVRGVK